MSAYVQISDQQSILSYGYATCSFKQDQLSIAAITGMSAEIIIPVAKINDFKHDTYYRWNRIQFNYNKKQYIFLYNNCRDFDNLRKVA